MRRPRVQASLGPYLLLLNCPSGSVHIHLKFMPSFWFCSAYTECKLFMETCCEEERLVGRT
jgi:hypothetical protein